MALNPGDQATFSIRPSTSLKDGVYNASYLFYKGDDAKRTHTVTVTASVKVVKAQPYVNKVVISPGSATVPVGKTMQFTAAVSGGNDYSKEVSWSVRGANSAGTSVNSSGVLTIASNESASSISVTATSQQNTSVIDTVTVKITATDHIVTVVASPADGGQVTGGGSVREGGSLRLSQSANSNYRFIGWYEGNNQISTATALDLSNITADRNIVAKFDRGTCNVKTDVNNSYAGTVEGGGTVAYGGKVTLTAKAKSGYVFERFIENNQTLSKSRTLELSNITSDRYITASFRRVYYTVNVSVSPWNAGSVSGTGDYDDGSRVTLSASAKSGYEFYGWSKNGSLISKSNTYVINSIGDDYDLVANFKQTNAAVYRISSSTSAGGSIVPAGDTVAADGSSILYTITPMSGYRIDSVVVDGQNVGAVANYTFKNVHLSHTIKANFVKISQTASAGTTTTTSVTGSATQNNRQTNAQTYTQTNSQSAQSNTQGQNSSQTQSNTQASNRQQTADSQQTNTPSVQEQKQQYAKEKAQAASERSSADESAQDGQASESSSTGSVGELVAISGESETAEAAPQEEPQAADGQTITADISDIPYSGGVLVAYGITEDDARTMIESKNDTPLLKAARDEGYLQLNVNSSYAKQQTADDGTISTAPTLKNFDEVAASVLTEDEKLAILRGEQQASFNVDLTENTDTVPYRSKKAIDRNLAYKPVTYFDFTVMKTLDADTTLVTETGKELEVTVEIPEEFRKAGRKFSVIRDHEGEITVLKDIGNDPNSVTFRTDRFSEYAIVYERINFSFLLAMLLGLSTTALIVAVVCIIHLVRRR